MSKREAFLESACKENVEDFLRFIQLHRDKTEPFDVDEVVQEMSRDQRQTLWAKLASLLHDVLRELPPERWDEEREEAMEVESVADPKHVMAVVDGVTVVAASSIEVLQDGEAYTVLVEIALSLEAVLKVLPVSEAPLQLHIVALCEAWWKKGLQKKETLGRTAILISLQKSLILKKPTSEIQRVWRLYDVLLGLNYTSEDNKQIINLLHQCFKSQFFIKNDDGKRFLVFLFSLNVDFIRVIHGTIKNQFQFNSKAITAHITEIYFRAWKKAQGDFLEEIEKACIQDFMQNAILLRRGSPVFAKVRQILSYFHKRKGCPRVERMLYKLYKPILWNALSVPNFEVRANATLLFTEAFPVYDPEDENKNMDTIIQKQLDTAMTLLDDPHPLVRSNAILGVCKILAKCWELLPPTVVSDFLKKLVELATDSSSPDVRCSVFVCLSIVLDNALSHPVLGKLLPTLRYGLHDTSEKVRTAFLNMLLKVKAVRAAKFWEVCEMDHLLARLATDTNSVTKRLVELLFESFFPISKSDTEWCCRCLTLIQMNPMAARKFYQLIHKHTTPTNIIKLMLAIRRLLNTYIKYNGDTSHNDGDKENSVAEPLLEKDKVVPSRLLEILVILWRSMEKPLKQNGEAFKYTVAKFGSVTPKYFQVFKDEDCTTPLIQLASFMPPAAVPTFSCGVLSRLRRMDPAAPLPQFSQLLDCMCSWGKATDILELVTDWLSETLPKQGDEANSNRRVQIQVTSEAKPDLALAYLEYLFSRTKTREKLLDRGESHLKPLHTVLGNWRAVLDSLLSATTEDPNSPSVETALKVFMYHCRLAIHLQHQFPEGRQYLLSLEHVAAWVTEKVLPFLNKPASEDEVDSEKPEPLAAQITKSFLSLCRDVILVGVGDDTFKGQVLNLCLLALLSEAGYLCIPAVLPILNEVAKSFLRPNDPAEGDQEDPTSVVLDVVANIFQKVIEILARRLRKEPEEGKRICLAAVPGLRDFLQVAQTCSRAPLCGVFSTLFAVIVVEKRHLLQKMNHPEEVIIPESVDDMPPLSSILLSVILKSTTVTRAFLSEVSSSLDSEAISSLNEVAAVLHILAVVKSTGATKASLKSAAASVQQQLHKHAVASTGSSDVQRVIYESSVKTLNDILDL